MRGVQGKLTQEAWEDKEGKKHSRIVVNAFSAQGMQWPVRERSPEQAEVEKGESSDDIPF